MKADQRQSLRWLREGSGLLIQHVGKIGEEQVRQPVALPGWTVAHLLTHLARNADALGNLTHWAATGVETAMYPGGPEQRLGDIEAGAARPADVIVRDVSDSADRLARRLAGLPDAAWSRVVRTAQGRLIPASLIPWLRVREVWIHTIDLGTGADFVSLPADLAAELLRDVTDTLAHRDGFPSLILRPESAAFSLAVQGDGQPAVEVAGPTATLLGWLTGRGDGTGLSYAADRLPALPAWL